MRLFLWSKEQIDSNHPCTNEAMKGKIRNNGKVERIRLDFRDYRYSVCCWTNHSLIQFWTRDSCWFTLQVHLQLPEPSNTVPERFLSSHCILCPLPYSSANKQDAINMYLCLLHPICGMNIVGYHLKMVMPKEISVICCALLCVFFFLPGKFPNSNAIKQQ